MLSVNKYAKALFELAVERKELEKVLFDLNNFSKAIEENKIWSYYSLVLNSEVVNKNIDNLKFESKTFPDFLKLIVKDKMIYSFKKIAKKFLIDADNNLNIAYVTILSKKELKGDALKKLNNNLKKLFEGKKIISNYKIDQSIISGIKIKYLGKEIDQTINSRLEKLFFNI